MGPGMIWGKGLTRSTNVPEGGGNKTIALKLCRNVTIRDVSVLHGGHFAILATGVDNLTIDNMRVDTDRDGFDIDCCKNVRVSNCTVNSPIFIRLGARMRGPDSIPVGVCRRINLSNIVVYNADYRHGCIISGLPGHPIEDLQLSNIRIYFKGGGTAEMANRDDLVPEFEKDYPEPYRWGVMPAYGFFLRHIRRLDMHDIQVRTLTPDARPAFIWKDVADTTINRVSPI